MQKVREAMISIILPVYNGEKTMAECVESVISQTYQDWELIIVNDGSKDKTEEILMKYSRQDSRIRILTKEKEGVSAARNLAIAAAHGEFLAFIDADDKMEPEMLHTLYVQLIKAGADISICSYWNWFENKKEEVIPCTGNIHVWDSEQCFRELFYNRSVLGFFWNKMFKRELLKENFFPVGIDICEDLITLCCIMRKSLKIVFTDQALYDYRLTAGSATHVMENKIDNNGEWKYLLAYQRIEELCLWYPNRIKLVRQNQAFIAKLGLEELRGNVRYPVARKQLLSTGRKLLLNYIRSDVSMKDKLSYVIAMGFPHIYLMKHKG